jgi:hypothetical protein
MRLAHVKGIGFANRPWEAALKKNLDMTLGFLEVFTGVLHCKLRFESLLRLLVQCVLKSWCVRCRGASITSPIKSGPLA